MRAILGVALAALAALAACNGILAIPRATLLVDDAGEATPAPGTGGCPSGQKNCTGTCVATDDVAMGCAADDCAPCGSQATNTTYTCAGGKCTVAACADGFKDCNATSDDGCETDIQNDTASCGACNKKCGQGLRCEAAICRCSDGPSCGFNGACDSDKVCSCGVAGMCSAGSACADDDTCVF